MSETIYFPPFRESTVSLVDLFLAASPFHVLPEHATTLYHPRQWGRLKQRAARIEYRPFERPLTN